MQQKIEDEILIGRQHERYSFGLAPIALFTYNRPLHTKRTLDALQKNYLANQSELFIFSDAPKMSADIVKVEQVRNVIKSASGFKKIHLIERSSNMGLAASIIDGASSLIDEYGKVIVLEDDLVTSRYFLMFMNEGLEFYQKVPNVFSLSGFSFSRKFMRFGPENDSDVYFHYRPMSWSWATWKERWETVDWNVMDYNTFLSNREQQKKFELGGRDLTGMLCAQMEGKIDSWYIRWAYACYKQGLLNVYPSTSLVNNIGHDGTGVHSANEAVNVFSHEELLNEKKWHFVTEPRACMRTIARFNRSFSPSILDKIRNRIMTKVGIIVS